MADSSVAVTAGSGTNVDTRTNTAGEHRQVMVIGNDGDVVAGLEPFGALQINTGYQTLFYDSWSTSPIDTVDKWTVSGTTPTVATGNMTMSATVSTYHAIRTKDLVNPNSGYTLVRNGIQIETVAAVGAGRFWGLGTVASSPSATSLSQDGIGFEIDSASGSLLAVTYAAGARTTLATLVASSAPSGTGAVTTSTVPNIRDGNMHAYGVYFRTTQAYWVIDSTPVATISFPNVQVASLPSLIVRNNQASFTGTPAFVNTAHLTADTSKPAQAIADPVIGTRLARVNTAGALNVAPRDVAVSGTLSATDAVLGVHGGAGVLLTGTPTASSYLACALSGGEDVVTWQVTGTFGSGTVWFECSVNSTTGVDGNWTTLSCRVLGTTGSTVTDSVTAAGLYRGNCGGMTYVRLRVTGATTPSIASVIRVSVGVGPVGFNTPLVAGTNLIGLTNQQPSTLMVTGTAALSTAVTVTLPAVAGQFHYVTTIEIQRYAAAALTGSATPTVVTSTNLPGSAAWTVDTAGAIGTSQVQLLSFAGNPLRSSTVNTATTIVAPTFTNAIWRINVSYYTAV